MEHGFSTVEILPPWSKLISKQSQLGILSSLGTVNFNFYFLIINV
jgi:hypothetical protein